MKLAGNVLYGESIVPAEIEFKKKIVSVKETGKEYDCFILPGFIDAHIHIESTMCTPRRFAEAAVPHGTTAVVTDPHEIANVLGVPGIRFMVRATHPLRIYFTAPSCVPATEFETSGARIGVAQVETLLRMRRCVALGEMMNYPGVVNGDVEVWGKIRAAQSAGKPIDGHAPLLSGTDLEKYVGAGISTDHECTTRQEAEEKAALGMTVMVREGSASKNMAELLHVRGRKFLVSDDLHPHDLLAGHVDLLLRRAVELGANPIEAVRMATHHPASHYRLPAGMIEAGRDADFCVVNNLKDFRVQRVFIGGVEVARRGAPLFTTKPAKPRSPFKCARKTPQDFVIPSSRTRERVAVIGVVDSEILTKKKGEVLACSAGEILPDPSRDILYLFVVNRHGGDTIGAGFVSGIGMREGALASSVAHDSHNIVVCGTTRDYVCRAVNALIDMRGGIVFISGRATQTLPLPVAGLMSDEPVSSVASKTREIQRALREAGSSLSSPVMTLSFLSLLVIPSLRLSDRGLFDVELFSFTSLRLPDRNAF